MFGPLVPLVSVFIQQPTVLSPPRGSAPVFKVPFRLVLVLNLFSLYSPSLGFYLAASYNDL